MSASPSAGINDENGNINVINTSVNMDVGDTEDADHDENDGMVASFDNTADADGNDHHTAINTSTSVDSPGLFAASLPFLLPIRHGYPNNTGNAGVSVWWS